MTSTVSTVRRMSTNCRDCVAVLQLRPSQKDMAIVLLTNEASIHDVYPRDDASSIATLLAS